MNRSLRDIAVLLICTMTAIVLAQHAPGDPHDAAAKAAEALPGIKVKATLYGREGMHQKIETVCTMFLFGKARLGGDKCRYEGGIAGHCLRAWDKNGVRHEASVFTSDRIGEIEDVELDVHPDLDHPQVVATPVDIARVAFTTTCQSNPRLPVWKIAEGEAIPGKGSVCLALTTKGFVAGVARPDPLVKDPMFYIDTTPFAGAVGADVQPELSDSGTGILCDNRIVGLCVGIPSDRRKAGFYSVGGNALTWLLARKREKLDGN